MRRDNLIDIYFKIERNILKNIEKIRTDHAYTIIYTFGKLMDGRAFGNLNLYEKMLEIV